MYAIESVIAVGVVGLLVGFVVGYFGRKLSKGGRNAAALAEEVETLRTERDDYQRQVYEQLEATAHKFKALDATFGDLHRQLASTASLLVGEAAGPLLRGPEATEAAAEATAAESPAGEETIIVAEAESEAPVVDAADAEITAETPAVPTLDEDVRRPTADDELKRSA